jgi:hypothetical protein
MAVTATFTPPTLSPVRSPLWVRVESDSYAPPSGSTVRATFTITFNTTVSSGDEVAITTGWGEVVLLCSASGEQDGLHFAEGASVLLAATAFLNGCLSNWTLTTYYSITRSGAVVTFVARAAGVKYNLQDVSFSPGGLIDVDELVAGVDGSFAENYSIVIRPWVGDGSGEFKPLGEIQCVPDEYNSINYDLSRMLRGGFALFNGEELRPDWPAFNTGADVTLHTKSTRPYYLEYYARFGTPAVTQGAQRIGSPASPKYAWLAGYERADYSAFTSFRNRVEGLLGAPHSFLTWRNRKDRRSVTAGEQHYLGWYHWPMDALAAAFQVQAKLTHTLPNGTDPQVTAWTDRYEFAHTDIPRGRIGSLAVGYGQLNMAALLPIGRIPKCYTVRVNEAETGPKSEEITFYLAPDNHNQVFLQFCSSLGVVESVRTRGSWVRSLTPEHEELMRPLRIGDLSNTASGGLFSDPLGGQPILKVNIGGHRLSEHEALLDILGSVEVRQVDYTNSRYLPLRMVKGEEQIIAQRGTEDEHIRMISLTFACDDPTALVTLPIAAGDVVQNEDDGFVTIPVEGEGG